VTALVVCIALVLGSESKICGKIEEFFSCGAWTITYGAGRREDAKEVCDRYFLTYLKEGSNRNSFIYTVPFSFKSEILREMANTSPIVKIEPYWTP
jgi:hypothetical protein